MFSYIFKIFFWIDFSILTSKYSWLKRYDEWWWHYNDDIINTGVKEYYDPNFVPEIENEDNDYIDTYLKKISVYKKYTRESFK